MTLFHFSVYLSGFLGDAHELMVESLNLFHQVYGPLHVDITTCYRYCCFSCFCATQTDNALVH